MPQVPCPRYDWRVLYKTVEHLKSDLVRVFQDFFKNGIINRRCNKTYVSLIPKKKEVVRVSDFIPISLTTSLCKVIPKVLAMRLEKIILSVISNTQLAFMEGRQILDAILIALKAIND